MKRACVRLPQGIGHYGHNEFSTALHRLGYSITPNMNNPVAKDVLVIWNRYGANAGLADMFERVGGRVIVVENGYMGKHWLGSQWFAVALGHHGGGGQWPNGGPGRWASWGVPVHPWCVLGGVTLVLGQRSIGELGIKSPTEWHVRAAKMFSNTRIRLHPGKAPHTGRPIEEDLNGVSQVFTWASSAAIKCLILGVPVFYEYKHWIGATASRHVSLASEGRRVDDESRQNMLDRLAWAMWRREEIATGEPLALLLGT